MGASTRRSAALAQAVDEKKKKTVLKDITNDGKEASKRKAAPPRKTSDVGPSTAPPVEGGIMTRSRSAKKPVAVTGRTAVIEKDAKQNNNNDDNAPAAPTLLEEKFDGAADPVMSSVNDKKRKAVDDIDEKDIKRQRFVPEARLTRAAARKIAGASLPGQQHTLV